MSVSRRQIVGLLGALSASAQTGGAEPVAYAEIRRRLVGVKLFFVPYSHNDYSWFATNVWHRERAALIDERAVEILRREPGFRWFIDSKIERIDPVTELKPEVLAELQRFAARGRVGISAGSIANNDNPFTEAEATIRNMVMGRRYFEKTFPGADLSVASFIDIHPGHTQMPQILRKAGYSYYRFTRPIWALDRKGFKREFVWRGADGSDVVVSYGPYGWLAGGWGMGKGPGAYREQINGFESDWGKAVEAVYESVLRHLIPNSASGMIWVPVGLDHTLPLSLPHLDERHGVEPSVNLPAFLTEWQKREQAPAMFATPVDYFREVEKTRDRLPRVDGIVDPVGWPFWYGQCGSRGLDNWRERTNHRLVEAEVYASLAKVLGVEFPTENLDSLWLRAMTLLPHDGLYVSAQDMEEGVQLGQHVVFECEQLRRRALAPLLRRITASPGQQTIALFNPLGWRRREAVEIQAVFSQPGVTRVKIVDGEGRTRRHQLLRVRHFNDPGEHMAASAKNSYKEIWALVDVEVPAMGYTTLTVVAETGGEEIAPLGKPTSVLENSRLRIELGETGVEVLKDRVRGSEYRGAGNPVYYKNDDRWPWHGGPINAVERIREAQWRLLEDGPLGTRAEMSGKIGGHAVTLQVSLHHTTDRVDFSAHIHSTGGSGYFAANVIPGFDGKVHTGVPFGAEPRDLSREPWVDGTDPNEELLRKNVFYGHHWVDYSDGQKGLTLLAAEGKRGFLFDPERRSLDHVLLMTIVPRGEMEISFSNPYFKGQGDHSFHYSLLPHGGDWREARCAQRAQENNHPIHAGRVIGGSAASLPASKSFLDLKPDTMAVTSWLWRDGAYELRLYETSGNGGPVAVRLPGTIAACRAVDFNGRAMARPVVTLSGDAAHFTAQPWEIVTLRFTLGRGGPGRGAKYGQASPYRDKMMP